MMGGDGRGPLAAALALLVALLVARVAPPPSPRAPPPPRHLPGPPSPWRVADLQVLRCGDGDGHGGVGGGGHDPRLAAATGGLKAVVNMTRPALLLGCLPPRGEGARSPGVPSLAELVEAAGGLVLPPVKELCENGSAASFRYFDRSRPFGGAGFGVRPAHALVAQDVRGTKDGGLTLADFVAWGERSGEGAGEARAARYVTWRMPERVRAFLAPLSAAVVAMLPEGHTRASASAWAEKSANLWLSTAGAHALPHYDLERNLLIQVCELLVGIGDHTITTHDPPAPPPTLLGISEHSITSITTAPPQTQRSHTTAAVYLVHDPPLPPLILPPLM